MANTKITTNVIADDAITSAKIADDAVGNDQLASGLTLGGNTTATLATAAQPNITSVGTLTALTVDDITINGSTISRAGSGDLLFDVGGNIQLDADDNGEIRFLDGGTQYATIKKDGTSALFQSIVADGDFIIQGIDGSSFISAVRFDMSDAGKATFNSDIVFGGTGPITSAANALKAANTGENGFLIRSAVSSAANPSYSSVDDTNTGMFFAAADTLGFTTASTERMRIDSSGNVLVGTTSSSGSSVKIEAHDATNPIIQVKDTTSNIICGIQAGNSAAVIRCPQNSPLVFNVGSGEEERMRIDSAGNVAIGTSNSISRLSIGNSSADGVIDYTKGLTFVDTTSSYSNAWVHAAIVTTGSTGFDGNLIFATDGTGTQNSNDTSGLTERMRLNSNGSLMIGSATNPTYPHKLYASGNAITNGTAFFEDTDGSCGLANVVLKLSFSNDNDATNASFIYMTDGNGAIGAVGPSSGTSVSYSTASDERLKENIVDASSQLDIIKSIKIREFDWKSNSHHELGLIAQEINTIIPDVVREGGDNVAEHPWSVDYGKLTPYIIKALQEQQTIIDDLKSRLETLEG